MTLRKGRINGFIKQGDRGCLIIDGIPVICDSKSAVEGLDAQFGVSAWIGKEIVYSVDVIGGLTGFAPADEWNGEDEGDGEDEGESNDEKE